MAEKGAMSALAPIVRDVRASLPLWLGLVIVFFAAFHLWQLTLLVLSFGELPNYLTIHDWPANIARIARMTPSVADMIPIMLDEWLIEIGSMNYAYGHGIAEWSFVIMPTKAAIVLLMSLLLATTVIMLRAARATCSSSVWIAASIGAAGGAFSAGLATMTITWVAHCGLPTWIVGLSIMGVDAVTAFAIEPFGRWLTVFGVLTLSLNVIGLGALAAESPASADTATRLRLARAAS
jgi:hypothetical protein